MQKGDLVKIGLGKYNKCTPFDNQDCLRVFPTTILSVSPFRQKRNGPAFTVKIDNVLKVVGIKRTDFYQIIDESEYVLLRMEQ